MPAIWDREVILIRLQPPPPAFSSAQSTVPAVQPQETCTYMGSFIFLTCPGAGGHSGVTGRRCQMENRSCGGWGWNNRGLEHRRPQPCGESGTGDHIALHLCVFTMLVCCRNKVPHTGWLKQRKLIVLEFWRMEIWALGVGLISSF